MSYFLYQSMATLGGSTWARSSDHSQSVGVHLKDSSLVNAVKCRKWIQQPNHKWPQSHLLSAHHVIGPTSLWIFISLNGAASTLGEGLSTAIFSWIFLSNGFKWLVWRLEVLSKYETVQTHVFSKPIRRFVDANMISHVLIAVCFALFCWVSLSSALITLPWGTWGHLC